MIAVRFASPVDFCRPSNNNRSAHNSIRKTRPARPEGALTDVMKTSLSLCTDTSSSFAAFAYVSIGLHGSRRAGSNNEQTTMRTTALLRCWHYFSAGGPEISQTDGRTDAIHLIEETYWTLLDLNWRVRGGTVCSSFR